MRGLLCGLRRTPLPRTRVHRFPADALGFSGWHHVLVEKEACKGAVVSPSILTQIGGLAAMVAGMLFVAAPLLGRSFPQALQGIPMEAFLVVALILVPVGMAGFHALQGRNYGSIGRVGLWMAVVGPLAVALGAA